MKLSPKQKEVTSILRTGTFIHWMDGIDARCFISQNLHYKLSTATTLRLEDLKLIIADKHREEFTLTELGQTITI